MTAQGALRGKGSEEQAPRRRLLSCSAATSRGATAGRRAPSPLR